MKTKLQENLIWIDLEMTGLNTDTDSILEVATIVTDAQLNELAEGPVFAIRHSESTLMAMDDWNRKHHSESGLWGRVMSSTCGLGQAEEETMAFLEKWTEEGKSPMCGNSICQDRRFMHRQMPALEKWFHYRNLDVSTIKELAVRWAQATIPTYVKKGKHEALSDVRESIEELRHYRQYMGQLSGQAID